MQYEAGTRSMRSSKSLIALLLPVGDVSYIDCVACCTNQFSSILICTPFDANGPPLWQNNLKPESLNHGKYFLPQTSSRHRTDIFTTSTIAIPTKTEGAALSLSIGIKRKRPHARELHCSGRNACYMLEPWKSNTRGNRSTRDVSLSLLILGGVRISKK